MTSARFVETSVTNNSSFQNYSHPDDDNIRTTDTPGFKPFTMWSALLLSIPHVFNLNYSSTDGEMEVCTVQELKENTIYSRGNHRDFTSFLQKQTNQANPKVLIQSMMVLWLSHYAGLFSWFSRVIVKLATHFECLHQGHLPIPTQQNEPTCMYLFFFSLLPFSLIWDFGKQNTHRNVSKTPLTLMGYRNPLITARFASMTSEGQKVALVVDWWILIRSVDNT